MILFCSRNEHELLITCGFPLRKDFRGTKFLIVSTTPSNVQVVEEVIPVQNTFSLKPHEIDHSENLSQIETLEINQIGELTGQRLTHMIDTDTLSSFKR